MKLGIITDVHEDVENLTRTLAKLQSLKADQIVCLGDVFQDGKRIEETCRLLDDAKVVGVWGNHDFGLCVEPSEDFKSRYSSCVINFMRSMKPRLSIDECHFSHIEPWLDPHDLADLWFSKAQSIGTAISQGSLNRIHSV